MRPAANPGNRRVQAGVGLVAVGLHQAHVVVGQKRGQFAMATGQPPVEDDVTFRCAQHPEIALGRALALFVGIDKLDRGLVALDVVPAEQFRVHEFVDGFGPVRGDPHPVGHAFAAKLRAPLRGHRLQAVKWPMPAFGLCRDA